MRLEFSRRILGEKNLDIKFNQIPVHWEPGCSMRTDRHYEASSRFSQFCERA